MPEMNISKNEQTIRILVGIICILVGGAFFRIWPAWAGSVVLAAGVILIMTGLLRWCPVFRVIGITKPGDQKSQSGDSEQ